MQKVVGEIFKSPCGRRLLAYYWFSILVPSSHHCMTVLWSTGASGDWKRSVKQAGDESTLTPSPTAEREGGPLPPYYKVKAVQWSQFPMFSKKLVAQAEVREQEHDTQHTFMNCGHVSSSVSRSHRCTEGTAAHESTFPVINPSSCGDNPFWFVQTWVMASEHQRWDCSQYPHTGSRERRMWKQEWV